MNTVINPAQMNFDEVYRKAPFSELVRLGLLLADSAVKLRALLLTSAKPVSGADQVAGH